ncbi:squalene/phytoene synthase family protein [Salinibacter altiplanensis]|uniref:squalene/phytoene synthase family protein n=1 Tax=Salinibacter altiplanensis TaxID=1803181 RepID=UPI000C9ED611|nr:squalene/phytoene synthase family protein [Salinibacter altiplanensis]
MGDDTHTSDLPRPFHDDWSRRRRPAARALWHWHSALVAPTVPQDRDPESFFDEERARAEAGTLLCGVPDETASAAYEACETHSLPLDWLGAQVEAARLLAGETRFEQADQLDTFVRLWAVPHARLLAHLADVTNSVQIGWVDELARGFFHLGHLLRLPVDLEHGCLFVPLEELRQYDVSVERLRTGPVSEGARRLLWKQCVRVRDALQRGRALADDLGIRQRYALLRYWHGALALLDELDRRDYDLWSAPIELSRVRRLEVYLLMLFGRR